MLENFGCERYARAKITRVNMVTGKSGHEAVVPLGHTSHPTITGLFVSVCLPGDTLILKDS
jgi:hypothetical protein